MKLYTRLCFFIAFITNGVENAVIGWSLNIIKFWLKIERLLGQYT